MIVYFSRQIVKFYLSRHLKKFIFASICKIFLFICAQVEAAFKKFDQTGNDKLNYREFCDMMNKKTERAGSRPRLATADSQTKPAELAGGGGATKQKQ